MNVEPMGIVAFASSLQSKLWHFEHSQLVLGYDLTLVKTNIVGVQ